MPPAMNRFPARPIVRRALVRTTALVYPGVLLGCLGGRGAPVAAPPAPDALTLNLGDDARHAESVPDADMAVLLAGIGVRDGVVDDADCGDSDRVYGASAARVAMSGGAPQTIIGLRVQRCGQPASMTEDHLLLMDGDKVLAQLADVCASDLVILPATAAGAQVLGLCAGSGQGYTEWHARVYGVAGGALRPIADLGLVGGDDCGVGEAGHVLGTTLHVAADGTWTAATWRRPCEGGTGPTPVHDGFPTEGDLGGGG